ncbi:MAG: glycerate kinase [Cyanobacteria bacterium]|nr:glycerate kinase [Cyanobacteriota bacterium]MDW8201811.1 glycerate kinase [Cyanobacteriota bacterium SKYGB_h_bin112]
MIDWPYVLNTTQLAVDQQSALASLLLKDRNRAQALHLPIDQVHELVRQQWQLLRSVYPQLRQHYPPIAHGLVNESDLCLSLWTLWMPLARLMSLWRQQLSRPLIVGIVGGQGTGKTTLSNLISLLLGHMGYASLSISLDDLYKTYADRQRLQQQDPRLKWRGPPGTHDVSLGIQTLDQLRLGCSRPIAIPRFDKSAYDGIGERTSPEYVSNIEIVLFEGWFVGVQPVDPSKFVDAPEPIRTAQDRQFARDMNDRLREYLPLWERIDRLLVLNPVDYRLSKQWRQQAERERIAAGGHGMSNDEVEQFVHYFWRALHPELFISPLIQNHSRADLVLDVNPDHSYGKVYKP